jgi:hypothetical protein
MGQNNCSGAFTESLASSFEPCFTLGATVFLHTDLLLVQGLHFTTSNSLSHEFLISFDSSDNFLSDVPSDSAGEMF